MRPDHNRFGQLKENTVVSILYMVPLYMFREKQHYIHTPCFFHFFSFSLRSSPVVQLLNLIPGVFLDILQAKCLKIIDK